MPAHQGVEGTALTPQCRYPDRRDSGQNTDILPAGAPDIAETPVDDGSQLGIVSEVLQQGGSGDKQGA